jgi:ABC-type polysaccharide/polyol phosphate export permease
MLRLLLNMLTKSHENYKELVWRLAKTDFKLRYHGSVLGYVWVILKPLLMFTILNFVFSSIFNFRNSGTPDYPLELLTGLLLFGFFSEATMTGMTSLVSKAQLVTKIYVPRWTIVLGSTMNALFIFGMNLIVLAVFFAIYHKVPTLAGLLTFFMYSIILYILAVAFSFLTAPFYVRFRDLSNVWEILLSVLMYASPIIYPLTMMPEKIQNLMLLSPFAFIVHYAKQGLINGAYTTVWHFVMLFVGVVFACFLSYIIFRRFERSVAELI